MNQQREVIKKEKIPIQQERRAFKRLQKIFKGAKLPLFSSENHLILLFDRGTCENPQLSGTILGKLYHDEKTSTLRLFIWPLPQKDEPPLTEPNDQLILLENVHDLKFMFYFPPPSLEKIVDPDNVGNIYPITGWQDQWLSCYQELPTFIKMHLKGQEDKTLEFIFDLDVPIKYAKEALS